jgi:hypothetical protein
MIWIKGRAIYLCIFLAIICISVSIKSTEKKVIEPFVKKLIPSKILIEETGEPTSPFPLYKPISVAEDSLGNIYILDAGNHCVVKYSSDGKYLNHWGKEGQGPGEFSLSGSGDSIYITNNDIIYIADRRTSRIQSFNSKGKILSSFITERSPDSICVDSKGNIMVSHALGSDNDMLIYVYNTKGETIRRFGTPFIKTNNYWVNTSYLIRDSEDNIYQVSEYLPVVRKFSPSGKMIYEKKIDLRNCKSINKIAEFWFNYKLDESKEEHKVFANGIFFAESYIFIHLADIYVLSSNGDVIGFYKYDSELGYFFLPEQMMIDKKTNNFLILFRGQDRVGAALFER